MKNILSILMIILFANLSQAQNSNYTKLWKSVEQLEQEGLPKSALKIVEQISLQAKKDSNTPQHIKSLLYKSKYALTLEKDAQLKIINDFKSEISQSEAPTKNILENLLANLYWQYFNQNRYKFYNRTKTENKIDTEDFRTWDLQTLFDEINIHFQNSLNNGLILKQTSLNDYKAIISEQKDSKLYRPTLFDLLSYNALDFYKTDENSITKPAYKFEIDDPKFLSDYNTFSNLSIESKDSTSLQLRALKIYQNLIKFHLKDKTKKALVDADIKRLKFVLQHATFSDKESLLLQTLKNESDLFNGNSLSTLYDFEIANIYYQQGSAYNPKTKTDVRWKIKDALELCETVIKQFPKSKGAEKCAALKSQILQYSVNIVSENIIPIQDYSRLLINYKNIDELNFKLFKVNTNEINKFNKAYRSDQKLDFFKNKRPVDQWSSTLKNESDYQRHSTEIIVPKLNNGSYIILAQVNTDHNIFATQIIQVTNLAIVEKTTDDKLAYQVIDRNNGKPVFGASVTIKFQNKYNGSFISKNLTSNKQGEVGLAKTEKRYINLTINVSYEGDKAYFGKYHVNNYGRHDLDEDKETHQNFLFTDRSIYRPGQTVYFKGIAMTTKDDKSEVFANKGTKVRLFNANGETINEILLKTNEFGSVAGEFILPNDGLNGQYYIDFFAGRYSYAYFSVEEYKRPKFETKFDPITETFKINDSITVKGQALAYAGSNITDAKVVYRVKRNVQYPQWYYWYRPWFNSEPQEITHGESITNEKGEFEITFKAIPDESVDKSSLPVFNYEITADVTDLNGETRSATTIVNVGYHALIATVTINSKLDKAKKDNLLKIDTKNLNGEFVPAKGTLKIYKLEAPTKVFRPRPWNAPDYQVITKDEFNSKFPHDSYSDASDSNSWEKGELVLYETFDTEISKEVKLGNIKKWNSGQYVILLESKDKFGQTVKDEAKTTLYSDNDKTIADNQLFSVTTDKDSYAANQNVLVTVASAAKDVTVTLDIEKDHKIIKTYIIPLSNNKKTIAIPVTKEDIGGFAVHYSFATFNSFQSSSIPVVVPYPKSDLEIETLTFRDKLQPGQDETWNFKIKGPKGDKVSAELLASMYDASLDQFKLHAWTFNPIQQPNYYSYNHRNAAHSFGTKSFRVFNLKNIYKNYEQQAYDHINWFGFYFGNGNRYLMRSKAASVVQIVEESEALNDEVVEALQGQVAGLNITTGSGQPEADSTIILRGTGAINGNIEPLFVIDGVLVDQTTFKNINPDDIVEYKILKNSEATTLYGKKGKNGVIIITTKNNQNKLSQIKLRKNLQETSFFFPQLQTDAEGNVSFSFTTPEALTRWKLQLLAHTKTLESAVTSLETVTQKELMVIPNAPRFLRQGDIISLSTKIANLTDTALSGEAKLILTDAVSGEDITQKLEVLPTTEHAKFTVNAKGNTQVSWTLKIPDNVNAVQYKVIAKAGDFSDGEQNAMPVLTNRMLVTETLPMWIKSNEIRTFTLDKLASTGSANASKTLKHHKLTLEMTSNPAWYAVQALPYLMEYPYDCNEQTFSRYYANALASHITNSNPRIQEVFNQWKSQDTSTGSATALISNLEKNEELKSILIQETPWLRDAQSETEQKKRIALLFDLNKMNNELKSAKQKLKSNQMANGAWAWFKGGRENRYITQHIITGFGHLKQLNVSSNETESLMIHKAIYYLDAQFVQEYKNIKKYNKDADLNKDHLSYTQLHYLYMRSFFPELKKSKEVELITKYYHTQIQKYWLSRSLYAKGLMALVTNRIDDNKTASKILNSLRENSITNEELGMYWKSNSASWYWYQAPIETQALLIEAFAEIENDTETIDNLKIWLLKNKQTNRWKTTKATTEAVYALLLQGSDWLSVTEMVDVVLGGKTISPNTLEHVKAEAGTGYYKTSWNAQEIQPEMAEVTLTKKGKGIAWGSLYWQYFEDLDKITSAETPLQLKKKLFLKTNTGTGEELSEITSETHLKIGDLVRVRIELQSDRNMEFIHMKDMRAAGLEPINVISKYKWQDGLGYYESTKDASTNFFFDNLPKGVYVFEYDLRVNNAGDMSNGITTIQSMYAPEFSSHSEGVRINVD
ncbi:alpha-2-macroglobulin family protein [Ichthyenterobacterium magnum]|uniref:Alpha-2-macroglobulin family protein n=1 Tax=Ichthyenterobacterium magnum TaxID=1230530 RepID=A0A420DF01_9FLAO|nr:alpha-2-macroglobulin family protein [Ichthyenterobacterium magnum]RKE90975.1 alpha-2-macroglobulin family protein [Ichthyenterobacterium magnum]